MKVFKDVDEAAREYWRVTGGDPEQLNRVPHVGAEPKFNEYYEPYKKSKSFYSWLAG